MSNPIESGVINSNEQTEEQIAAQQLLEGNVLLSGDPYAKRVIENNGVSDSGERIDLGNFLASRLAILEEAESRLKQSALKKKDPSAYMAAYSVRPDVEEE